jgi:hypothetical protein
MLFRRVSVDSATTRRRMPFGRMKSGLLMNAAIAELARVSILAV